MKQLTWEEHEKLYLTEVSQLPSSHYGECKTWAEACKLEDRLCDDESLYDYYVSKEVVKYNGKYYVIAKDDLNEEFIINKGMAYYDD